MHVGGYGLRLGWNQVIMLWTAGTQWKGHIRKEEDIQLCSLSSQVFMYYVCPESQSARPLKHPSLLQRQEVGWADNSVILAAGIHLICLSELRSSSDMFPSCLLFREKVVSYQYLGKCNIHIYCVIYDGVKFHTVLQVTWNVFALACPLTALNWITGISLGIYSGRSCSLNHLLPLGGRAVGMLLLCSVPLGILYLKDQCFLLCGFTCLHCPTIINYCRRFLDVEIHCHFDEREGHRSKCAGNSINGHLLPSHNVP